MIGKQYILGMSMDEIRQLVSDEGLPRFVASQLMNWVYVKRATSFDEMTNISKVVRARLAEKYCIGRSVHCLRTASVDGTVKYLFPTIDGQCVETVFIPDDDRGTICVSCQVGCKMGCKFCMTGRQGFHGHCTATDIMNQILSLPEFDRLTNIVFMGQGEPFDNLDAVMRATELLTSENGMAWSPRRITVSTVGLSQGLQRFIEECDCHLAVSMHHPAHEGRLAIMPAEKPMPIAEVVSILKQYDWAHQRRLTFEYIVFDGMNNTPAVRKQLVDLLRGLPCRVNLIRFHTIPDSPFRGASEPSMEQLRDYLNNHGITCTIRASRGEDIFAACGMLSTKEDNKKV